MMTRLDELADTADTVLPYGKRHHHHPEVLIIAYDLFSDLPNIRNKILKIVQKSSIIITNIIY